METGAPQQQQGRWLEACTQGCLDLERDPLLHIIEECSKENPKLQRSQPITTEYGELHFSLSKWARCLLVMIIAFP